MAAPRCRVWTYDAPAVVLGCSQRRLRDDVERRLGGRAAVVQRESGGGAVLTGPWLVGASIVLPQRHRWVCGGLIDSYRRIGELHAAALGELGVAAHALSPQDLACTRDCGPPAVADWACFGGLSPWEVVSAEGRKLTGLAQRRCRSGVLLVAGTLVGPVDWTLLGAALGRPEDVSALRRRTACAAALAGRRIAPEQLASALSRRLERALAESGDDADSGAVSANPAARFAPMRQSCRWLQ